MYPLHDSIHSITQQIIGKLKKNLNKEGCFFCAPSAKHGIGSGVAVPCAC